MPFPSALTSDQLIALRGSASVNPAYAASEYAVFIPGVPIFQAQVNGSPTGASYAQLTFNNVSLGAYADIRPDMTVYVGSTTDLRTAEFVGRVRADNSGVVSTSSILNVNETSVSILNDWYITVVRDWRVCDRLARQSGSTQLKDYAITFRPPPPIITGLSSGYGGITSGSPEVLTLSFAPTGFPIASGATINAGTWLWEIPSGATITVGSTTTQNITVEFNAGFKDWLTVQVDDNNGETGYFHFPVAVPASDLSDVVNLNIVPGGLQGDENGWTAGVEAFAGIDDLTDNCLVILFDDEYYCGVKTSILSNVKMVARIRKESNNTVSDPTYSQLKKATLDLEGTLAQFGRIEHLPFTLLNAATPTKFDEIKNLTLWRALCYTLAFHSTYLTLHSLTFDSTDTTFLYLGIPTQGGNILSVIQDIAVSNNATIESAPQGETRVYRNGVYLSGAQRAALVTVADFTMQDLINIDSLEVTEVDTTGKIQGSGGFYNSISGKVTPLLSLAPGVAQGIGEGISSFTRQVLAANVTQAVAQAELNTRTGHEYEAKRREGVFMTLTMPPGYNFLVPSRSQWYTWTIAASDTTGGRAFTTAERWQLFSVSYQHDNAAGTKSPIQATFKLETEGTAGQTVVYPAQTTITPILPVVPTAPGFPTFPPPPDIILPPDPTSDDAPPYQGNPAIANGNLVNLWTSGQSWNAPNLWYTNTPSWTETTPNALTTTDEQWAGLGSKIKFQISNDGTDSVFSRSEDGTAPNPVWTSTSLSGVYTKIRVGSTASVVYLYGTSDPSPYTLKDTFTVQGDEASYTPGSYSTIIGNTYRVVVTGLIGYGVTGLADAQYLSPDETFGDRILQNNVQFSDASFPSPNDTTYNPLHVYDYTRAGNGSPISLRFADNDYTDNSGSWDIDVYESAGGLAQTVYSDDNGDTFASPEVVGTSPGAFGGIDTQKVGSVALAGAAGQVMKATSGSSWVAYGGPMPALSEPSCIVIPRYKSNGSSNSGSTPDYLVASASLTAGNEAVFYVSAGGTVFTDITKSISGDFGIAVSPDCLTASYKIYNRYSMIADFDGDRHLLTTVNAGGAWSDRGTVAEDAGMVRYRNGDISGSQIFLANGADGIIISPSHGSNLLTTKAVPSDDPIIGLVPFG